MDEQIDYSSSLINLNSPQTRILQLISKIFCNYAILLPVDTQVLPQMLIQMRMKMIPQGK